MSGTSPTVSITAISGNGWMRMSFSGVAQSAAINNHPIVFYFDTLTVNFKA
jgi:hypothetical protein